MSSDTRLTRRCTMAVRIFLVILNFEALLVSREMSRCLKNCRRSVFESIKYSILILIINAHLKQTIHIERVNCAHSAHSSYLNILIKNKIKCTQTADFFSGKISDLQHSTFLFYLNIRSCSTRLEILQIQSY